MKTLIKNSTTGLMIGAGLVIVICAIAQMGREAAYGAMLLIGCAIVKSIIS